MSNIKLTYRALSDLDSIYTYSHTKWGSNIADQYLSDIEKALQLLEEYPNLLKINNKISRRFRIYPIRNHFLVCEIVKDDLYVLTIQYMAKDLLNNLKELAPTLEEEARALYKKLRKS